MDASEPDRSDRLSREGYRRSWEISSCGESSYPDTDRRRAYMRAYMAKRRAPAQEQLRVKRQALADALAAKRPVK